MGPTLIDWWVGGAVAVPFAVFAGLGAWKVMEATGHAVVMFLNGANQLTVQVACTAVTAVASVALKVWFTSHIGVAGIPLGMIIAYGIFTLPFLSLAVRHALCRLDDGMKQ